MLRTSDGKEMSAIKVISAVIGYLKGHLMETIKTQGVDVSESDIRWVVTVPTIWSDAAKQMMREAVERTGIARNQLILALEPEAASMLCKNLPEVLLLYEHCTDKVDTFRSGAKYMVFDAGGGTIDITVHEVLKGGFLKEIYAANGGDWGGTKVDEAFEEFMESIVGKAAFQHFKDNDIPSAIDLQRYFEVKKKTFTGEDIGTKTTLIVPCSLLKSFRKYNRGKQIADAIEVYHCSTDVEWKRDKVRLSQKKTLTLFEQSFKHITEHVCEILSKPEVKDCEAILMVGGYSECSLLQDAIRTIAGGIRLIVPSDANLAVLKGAVINGHCPDTVSERICKYTYGTDSRKRFKEGVHRKDYRVIDESGEICCKNSFSSLVKKGTHINIGTSSFTDTFSVATLGQTGMCFGLYASTSVDPLYITDASCQKIGAITLDMPDTSLGLDRGARVTMYFGGSEVELKAVDKHTGNEIRACFDLLVKRND
ncbi:Heat shock 70 kDa protein 12B [Mizuhopecten yessoensis]|uniref:Heat shock 70 kDa protein n=1 Tax=Mizuhopecten yessoensis TaxID=6573 RepID=A0A1C9U2Y6_MIZYE|nr:heat shock 70 kDa protein [Mizuhopecten yessoensis]OWF47860.1 Heat shock 70 kDa protein 12B [Mizuhopecten yessoensis]